MPITDTSYALPTNSFAQPVANERVRSADASDTLNDFEDALDTLAAGRVRGPASVTDGHLVQFDGTTGKLVKGGKAAPSGVVVGDTDTQTLTNKSLTSPTLTGTPVAPTAAADTNTTQIATTAYVVGQAGSSTPAMDGVAAVGTSKKFARDDHVHPSDTSRAALAGAAFTGAVSVASTSANALAAGANGTTNPALQVDASTASSATGVKVKSAAAAGGVAMSAISSGTNEDFLIDAKGSGVVKIATVSTGGARIDGNVGIGMTPTYKLDVLGTGRVGSGSGGQYLRVNGGGSGTASGPAVLFETGGTFYAGFGFKSAIQGGAYDPTIQLYAPGGGTLEYAIGPTINITMTGGAVSIPNGILTMGAQIRLKSYTVSTLPSSSAGDLAYASDARKNGEGAGAGTGSLVWKDGTAWRTVDNTASRIITAIA